jgi:hypothetical protein
MSDQFKIVNLMPGSGLQVPAAAGTSIMSGGYDSDTDEGYGGGDGSSIVSGGSMSEEALSLMGVTHGGFEEGNRDKSAVTAEPAKMKAIPPDHPDNDNEDSQSSSSTMSTASLIANGCMYTILEQMLMTPGGDTDDSEKVNVAALLKRIAVALEVIAVNIQAKK